MRILKRNLAFVLAMVMALSLTVSAMGVEDYSDVNEIAFVEAVDVMTEMGILEGTDGEFNPTKVLNRAEAAKIIAYMLLGKNAADNLQAVTAPFADVPANHWAAGYIAHCVNEGIINGVSATEYNPKGELTATAFAKMLLSAVGYNVNGEFTGARWETEVNALALKLGVFNGNLGADLGAGCTREEAALYAFNTLMKIDTVKYSELFGTYYSGTSVLSNEGAQTLNEELYDFAKKADTDAFGREGYVWVNAKNKEVTGLYGVEADAVYTAQVKSKTLYADLGLSETTVADVILNGDATADFQIKKNSTTNLPESGNGVLVEAYVDEDENVTIVIIDTYMAVVNADAEDGEVEVTVYMGKDNEGNTVTDVLTYETAVEYAEDDMVLVTVEQNGTASIQSMVPAEIVNGELTAVGSNYLKLDDEKYSNAANLVQDEAIYEVAYDVEMNLYVDEYGYVMGLLPVDETIETDGYVYVVDSQAQASDLIVGDAAVVKVMYMDGTGYEVLPMATKVVSGNTKVQIGNNEGLDYEYLKDLDEAEIEEPVAPGFYAYYMNDDEQIVLVALDGTKEFANDEATIVADGKNQNLEVTGLDKHTGKANMVMNNSTVLNIVTEKDVTTHEGYKNIKIDNSDEDALKTLVIFSGRTVKEIYVVDGELIESDIYAYFNGASFTTTKGTWVTMYVKGEPVNYLYDTEKMTNAEVKEELADGIYVIAVEDNELADVELKKAETTAVTVASVKNDYFTGIKGANHYYADDAKIYDVTNDGAKASISKDDVVVFVKNDINLVTYAYIIDTVDEDATTNDDIVVIPDLTFTVDVDGATATVDTNAENAKMNVYVYNAELGMKALIEANLPVGEFKAEATGVYTFELVVNDEPVAEIEKAIFVTAQ